MVFVAGAVMTIQVTGCTKADRTAPEAEPVGSYTIVRPGELSASAYVKKIQDDSETHTGFLAFDRLGDLSVMTEEELKNYALSEQRKTLVDVDGDCKERVRVSRDGIYKAQICVADIVGNQTVFTHIFYVDGTAPDIDGVVDQTIKVSNEEGTFRVEGITITDNLNGDLYSWDTSVLEMISNGDGTPDQETFTLRVYAEDLAGNHAEKEAQIQVCNTYHRDAVNALLEAQKKHAEAESGSLDVRIQNGWNRTKAEEAFATVNDRRQEQGVPGLSWDEGLYELACIRAEEIVQSFSHDSPSGSNDGCAENIAANYSSVQNLVNAWMDSEGHRANILDARGVRGAVACYLYDDSFYWVQLFAM
ncbi:MAG: CAP domain-containing protein [Clostridiales bacterium]|nr:CAP domain-containing protein [Clostridiales bacterium]